jgi:hypothetical protein
MTATWSVKSTVMPVSRRILLCVAALALGFGACNSGDDKPAACGPDEAQAIDPTSSQHLLPGAPVPDYNTNPPTSGAHAPGNYEQGIRTTPIERQAQTAMLEAGAILVQYDGIRAAQLRELRDFARDNEVVTIAPNDTLPTPVVATAWLYMQRCTRVDTDVLEDFVAMHAGKSHAD